MDKFGKLFEEVNKNAPKGMQIEVARQTQNGHMISAKPQELATLSTKSRIASTAHLLQNLTKEEKLQWALETKEEANQLYREKRFSEAMERYVETLTATNFGNKSAASSTSSKNESKVEELIDGSEIDNEGNVKDSLASTGVAIIDKTDNQKDDNVEELVIPVLCNLAACCVELQQWAKVALFVDQILQLRPLCRKAHYRHGIALLNLNEYSLSIKAFETALESLPASSTAVSECMPLNDSERQKVKHYLQKAIDARKKELVALDKRKSALQKAFGGSSNSNNGSSMTMMAVERRKNEDGEDVLILHPSDENTPATDSDKVVSPESTDVSPAEQQQQKQQESEEADMSFGTMLVVMFRYYLEQLLFLVMWILGIAHWIPPNSPYFISQPYASPANTTVAETSSTVTTAAAAPAAADNTLHTPPTALQDID